MSDYQESGWSPVPPPEPPSEPPGTPVPPGSGGPPWESGGPWFTRLIDTVRLVLFQPTVFFRTMNQTGGLGSPLVFYLVGGAIGAVFAAVYNFMFQSLAPSEEGLSAAAWLILTLVLLPAVLVVAVFISSGIYHLILMLLGGATRAFETTFRVVAYSGGATSLIGVIPICGGFIGVIWQIILVIIGLAETHRISTGKAAAAVLLPAALCCLLFMFIGFLFFATIAAFLASAGR